MNEKKAVLLFMIMTLLLVTIDEIRRKTLRPEAWIGVFVIYLVLSFFAEFQPKIAAPFAALVFFAILLSPRRSVIPVFFGAARQATSEGPPVSRGGGGAVQRIA